MTNEYIEVYCPGTKVKIEKDLDAIITAISIRGKEFLISYECQWVNEKIISQWVDDIMVHPYGNIQKIKIGFNNKET